MLALLTIAMFGFLIYSPGLETATALVPGCPPGFAVVAEDPAQSAILDSKVTESGRRLSEAACAKKQTNWVIGGTGELA